MKLKTLIFLFFLPILIQAQFSAIHTEINKEYKKGLRHYEDGLFPQSYIAFEKNQNVDRRVDEATFRNLKQQAEMLKAQAAIKNGQKEGEVLMTDFVRNNRPDPLAYKAAMTVADYYFDSDMFPEALDFYDRVDIYNLSEKDRDEVIFKKGYAHFVRKDFDQALGAFNIIKNSEGKYYYPSNYYLGMSYYFSDDFAQAEDRLRLVENSKAYKPYIPYYIAQILFVQSKNEELVQYGESRLDNRNIRKVPEIKQLVGRAHFELQNYDQALTYLEDYAAQNTKMSPEEFYLLGFLNYKQGKTEQATTYLKQLLSLETSLGQAGQYMLGNAYLELDRKEDALVAFQKASVLDFDKEIRDEAIWNFAKLSYETQSPNQILILQGIKADHPRFNEAQELMSYVLLNSRDVDKALEIIEAIPNRTAKLERTYQEILYYKGLEAQRIGDRAVALLYLDKSVQIQRDPTISALATFWKASIELEMGQQDNAYRGFNSFLQKANGFSKFSDEANPGMANYNLGYIALQNEDYKKALGHFENAINYISKNTQNNDYVKRNIAGDIILRIGDCHLTQNNYQEAARAYDNVIKNKFAGFDYALYQKAVILGLQGDEVGKFVALETISDKYPESEYADDALYLAASGYVEINKKDQAIDALKRLIQKFPKSYILNEAYLKLGLISFNEGAAQEAIDIYKKVVDNNPTSEERTTALIGLEEIYVTLGRNEEFVAYKKDIGVEVRATDLEKLEYRTAKNRRDNNDFEGTIKSCNIYLEKFPRGQYALEVLSYRGNANAILENWTAALSDFEAIVQKGRSKYYTDALLGAAEIANYKVNNTAKAYQFYKLLSEAGEDDQSKYTGYMGMLETGYALKNRLGVNQAAEMVFKSPIASPEDKAKANFYVGKFAYENGETSRALIHLREAVKANANEATAEARYLIAKIYYDNKEIEVAQKLATEAVKKSQAYPDWLAKSTFLLSDTYYANKDYSEAVSFLLYLKGFYKSDNQQILNELETKLKRAQKAENENSNLLVPVNQRNQLEMEERQ